MGKTPKRKPSAITAFMMRDHAKIGGMAQRFVLLKEADPPAAGRLFSQLKMKLLRHMAWEEEVLFPLFEEKSGLSIFGATSSIRAEHRQIRNLLGHIDRAFKRKSGKDTHLLEQTLISLLKTHDKKEDEIVLPWVDRVVEEDEKGDLVSMMTRNLAVPIDL